MDSSLPQRFPWNLWRLLQSNPLLPSQALEAHQTQFPFQAHPGSPSLSISVPALALHPKPGPQKLLSTRNVWIHLIQQNQTLHTLDNCVISREGFRPFSSIPLPPGCRTSQEVRNLGSKSSSLGGGSETPSTPHYSLSRHTGRVMLKDIQCSWIMSSWIMNQQILRARCWRERGAQHAQGKGRQGVLWTLYWQFK